VLVIEDKFSTVRINSGIPPDRYRQIKSAVYIEVRTDVFPCERLFAIGGQGRPSKGKFVKLTF